MGLWVEVGEETRTEKGVGPGNGAGGRESLAATISHVEFLTMGHENPYFFFPSQHGHLVLSTLCESARVWSCRLEQAPPCILVPHSLLSQPSWRMSGMRPWVAWPPHWAWEGNFTVGRKIPPPPQTSKGSGWLHCLGAQSSSAETPTEDPARDRVQVKTESESRV